MTRLYPRGSINAIHNAQLGALIDAATSRTGTAVAANNLTVFVDHPALEASDDAAVLNALASYTFDATYGVPAPPQEELNLSGIVPAMRSWVADGNAELALWDGQTTAQRFAACKVLLQRFVTLVDREADLLTVLGKGQ